MTSLAPYNCVFNQDNRYQFLSGCYENTNFRALFSAEAALEVIPDAIENIVAGLLHLEGEGVAAVPDLDEEETLEEVLDGEQGRNT